MNLRRIETAKLFSFFQTDIQYIKRFFLSVNCILSLNLSILSQLTPFYNQCLFSVMKTIFQTCIWFCAWIVANHFLLPVLKIQRRFTSDQINKVTSIFRFSVWPLSGSYGVHGDVPRSGGAGEGGPHGGTEWHDSKVPPYYLNIMKLNRWDTFRKVFPSPFLNSFNLVKSKTTFKNEHYRDKW